MKNTAGQMALRLLTGFDVAKFRDEQARLRHDEHATTVQTIAAHLLPLHDWTRKAQDHLGTLQAAHDRLTTTVGTVGPTLAAVQQWMTTAEQHLAALQTDHERIVELVEQQTAGLARLVARVVLLEERVGDLERADTEIAAALSSIQSVDSLE